MIENEKDPNDTCQLSFMLDREEVEWVDKHLAKLKEYDPGFYVKVIGVGDVKHLYKITTKQRNTEHEDFKKFMFQLELKLGNKLKIR